MPFSATRQTFFPHTINSNITVKAVDQPTVYAVTGKIANQLFESPQELGLMPFTPAPKPLADAFQTHREQFVFYADDTPIGWVIGAQQEADTFLMQWTGILPEYQNQGIYTAFLQRFVTYLEALEYARVTSNHMVNNRPVLIAKLKAGFIPTSMRLDERVGAVICLTYYIDKSRQEGFEKAFRLEKR